MRIWAIRRGSSTTKTCKPVWPSQRSSKDTFTAVTTTGSSSRMRQISKSTKRWQNKMNGTMKSRNRLMIKLDKVSRKQGCNADNEEFRINVIKFL